jgi:hypothetical protein
MQAISWTASQAGIMAQIIPVIALALGLELREVRKFFDDRAPENSHGKHAANRASDGADVEPEETGETGEVKKNGEAVDVKKTDEGQEVAKEFLARRDSRYILIGFWGCLAMIILLVGEQSSIAIVLGRSSYNNLNEESLAIRAALTIVFLSPAAQLIFSFIEAGFRQKKTSFEKRYRLLGAVMIIMTAIGFVFIFRGY